jgi:hypothetical protein
MGFTTALRTFTGLLAQTLFVFEDLRPSRSRMRVHPSAQPS